MTENNNTECSPIMKAPERNVDDEPEVHVLTQEEVNEQIKSHIAHVTRQLEVLTRLIQGMSTAQHPTFYPGAGAGASFSAAGYQPDTYEENVFFVRTCKVTLKNLARFVFI